jgi:hypothetical protein
MILVVFYPFVLSFSSSVIGIGFTCRGDCGKGMQGKEIRSNLTECPKMFFAEGCRPILTD